MQEVASFTTSFHEVSDGELIGSLVLLLNGGDPNNEEDCHRMEEIKKELETRSDAVKEMAKFLIENC